MVKNNASENESCGGRHALRASILSALAVASLTYFFFGTQKGARTRKQLGRAACTFKNKALEMKARAAEVGDNLSETSKEIYEDMAELFREKQEQFKKLDSKDIARLAQSLHDRWEETKEDIEETLADAS